MEGLIKAVVLILSAVLIISTANAQTISTPCTASMISSFTPCLNFITGSSGNGNSPTKECCDSLKSLMSTSMQCTCLIFTANVPFPIPTSRSLAISLPRLCKTSVPIQCKAAGSPLPAPGPVLFAPPPPPPPISPSPHHNAAPPEGEGAASPLSPQASKAAVSPQLAQPPAPEIGSPESNMTPADASTEPNTTAPTNNPGIRLSPTSSNSNPTIIITSSPPFLQLIMCVGVMVLITASSYN